MKNKKTKFKIYPVKFDFYFTGIIFTLIIFFSFFGVVKNSEAAITFTDGKWESTFDCAEYTGTETWNCDGIDSPAPQYKVDGHSEEVVSAANNPIGAGGRGLRHWVGDGIAINTSGVNVRFPTAQTELWIRWYMKYEEGWVWNPMSQHKLIYMKTSENNDAVAKFDGTTQIKIVPYYASGSDYPFSTNYGWTDVMGGSEGDGVWHSYEIYLKMDTGADGVATTNGVGRFWVDDVLRTESVACNWSNGTVSRRLGWTYFNIGTNQATPANSRGVALDYDDVVVYTTTPPNIDSEGNLYIGPIESSDTTPPSHPTGLSVE